MRDKPGNSPFADQAAQSVALSRAAEARIENESGHTCSFVRISDRPQPPLALAFQIQTKLAVFRTDLDAPKWGEIQALLLHGFSCHRQYSWIRTTMLRCRQRVVVRG